MNKVPLKAVLAILGALLYGASPIDLIPDLIPLLGLMDDALMIPLLLAIAVFQMRSRRKTERVPARIQR